ncbi:unnamed protein product [Dracunculus medinensis]|uniref:F-box domain-containing protein n=1 Tax=Dracunculus medinensis TaxID=318479 RepID=A0A0N4UMH7_DRAME|nr:unnamed protein product [Dracunculus medinensis]
MSKVVNPRCIIHINDLPSFILKYIFSLLNPYDDFDAIQLVCRYWYEISVKTVVSLKKVFDRCNQFKWSVYEPDLHTGPFLAERCSQSSCYHAKSKMMYIFGGCTAAYTAFNDLWAFDLSRYTWSRVLIKKPPFPSPKALATLLAYKDNLLLFGGFSKSSPNPIHQTSSFYNELHLFDTEKNHWVELITENSVPKLASHTASIIGDSMVVFGGSMGNCSTNEVWVLDIPGRMWLQPQIAEGSRPAPRYGHSQIMLDENHLVILGGCGGPNMIYSDCWMLSFDLSLSTSWIWQEIKVTNPKMSAPHLWSHAACRVGSNMLVLSRPLKSECATFRHNSLTVDHILVQYFRVMPYLYLTNFLREMRTRSKPTPINVRTELLSERRVAESVALRRQSSSSPSSSSPPSCDRNKINLEPSSADRLSCTIMRRKLLTSKSLDKQVYFFE